METKQENIVLEPGRMDGRIAHVNIDDLLVSLKYYVDEEIPHVKIISPEVCVSCEGKGCLSFCPAGVYQEGTGGHVQVAYQACVECGSCRLLCSHKNIDWDYPRGGFGISYKFG
jgi:ferredoxin like protein